tara:strand:- start:1078 stop:2178 length:1101 start_codon:yes stop_codon:yes gene_type:complete
MLEFFGNILTIIYDFFPNYAFAIIIFTCLVMIVLTPVTLKQTRSMLAMQKVAPELKKLRKKHGNDRDKLNQEMMALYQANGINPLAGCLPLIAQMPIFFGLFYTVRGLTRRTGEVGLRLGDVSIVDQSNTEYVPALNARVFNPDFIGTDTEMYRDLALSTEMSSLGMDLALSPWNVMTNNFTESLPYLLLVLLVGLSAWYQQRMISNRSSSSMSEMPAQQQLLMKYMPFMLPIFSFTFPAALVFYFLTSNAFRVLTQLFITRKYYGENADTSELIKPTKEMVESVQKQKPGKSIDQSEIHGTRRHLTNPPKKRSKKTKPPETNSPKKGKVAERKEPQARPTSKRVTPKKNIEPDTPGSRRRKKKKK